MLRATLLASTAALCVMSAPVLAQGADAEAQRQAIFEQMLNDPGNRALMRDYARSSVQLREFEAAAATLERLLDQDPQNTAARVELAIAYFALGNYDVAEYHLAAAERSGALTPAQQAEVARYRREVDSRTNTSQFTGRIEVGYAFTEESEEEGPFINAALEWRIDLGGPFVTQWVTEAGYSSYSPDEEFTANSRQNFRLRTGPEFRLQGDAYGPRLQPYIEFGLFDGDEFTGRDSRTWEFGVAYQNPLNEQFTVYGDFSYGFTEFTEEFASPEGLEFYEVEIGATYRPSRDTRIRLTGLLREEETDEFFGPPQESTITGARLSAQHAFDIGLAYLPNRWVIGGFADYRMTEQEGLDILDNTYGAWLRAFVYEDIYVEVSASQIMSEQDFGFFIIDTEETIMSVQLGWEF